MRIVYGDKNSPVDGRVPDDPVRPKHYKGDVECIDALAVVLGRNGVEDFCTGNAIKYLWRWRKKNGLEDLKKAQWYLSKLISYVEEDISLMREIITSEAQKEVNNVSV